MNTDSERGVAVRKRTAGLRPAATSHGGRRKKSSAQLAAARNNHQTRSSRRKDVLNIESELNRLFDLRHQSGRKLSELSFQSRQRYRTNSLNVGYGEFCQERQLAQFNFVTTASVLRGERDIDKEDESRRNIHVPVADSSAVRSELSRRYGRTHRRNHSRRTVSVRRPVVGALQPDVSTHFRRN